MTMTVTTTATATTIAIVMARNCVKYSEIKAHKMAGVCLCVCK